MERLGYSYKEFLNITPADIVTPDKPLEMTNYDLNLIEKGYIQFEIIHQAKYGNKIPVEVNKHLFELRGKNVGMAISRDITKRKHLNSIGKGCSRKGNALKGDPSPGEK